MCDCRLWRYDYEPNIHYCLIGERRTALCPYIKTKHVSQVPSIHCANLDIYGPLMLEREPLRFCKCL